MYNFDKKEDYNKDNISITVKIDTSEGYGCFEYEEEMFGEQESIYFEGGLLFEDDQLIEHNSVDELPEEVIKLIHKLGYKTDYIQIKGKRCH